MLNKKSQAEILFALALFAIFGIVVFLISTGPKPEKSSEGEKGTIDSEEPETQKDTNLSDNGLAIEINVTVGLGRKKTCNELGGKICTYDQDCFSENCIVNPDRIIGWTDNPQKYCYDRFIQAQEDRCCIRDNCCERITREAFIETIPGDNKIDATIEILANGSVRVYYGEPAGEAGKTNYVDAIKEGYGYDVVINEIEYRFYITQDINNCIITSVISESERQNDKISPIVVIISPKEGETINGDTPIIIDMSDNIGIGELRLNIDSEHFLREGVRTNSKRHVIKSDFPLPDGSHTLTIEVVDYAFNIVRDSINISVFNHCEYDTPNGKIVVPDGKCVFEYTNNELDKPKYCDVYTRVKIIDNSEECGCPSGIEKDEVGEGCKIFKKY